MKHPSALEFAFEPAQPHAAAAPQIAATGPLRRHDRGDPAGDHSGFFAGRRRGAADDHARRRAGRRFGWHDVLVLPAQAGPAVRDRGEAVASDRRNDVRRVRPPDGGGPEDLGGRIGGGVARRQDGGHGVVVSDLGDCRRVRSFRPDGAGGKSADGDVRRLAGQCAGRPIFGSGVRGLHAGGLAGRIGAHGDGGRSLRWQSGAVACLPRACHAYLVAARI